MQNEVQDHGGKAGDVPEWEHHDYDSIYVARIRRDEKGVVTVSFHVDEEGLNGLSSDFPRPAGSKPK